ncbi:MAG: molecular chaperone HtpG [Oscillospiraceae bacterium]|nr:molecular chaperone HtpG [Oscillospiraceae bacterium]
MAKKQFKSESKRLLELMVNSIYTHREIFLRELISNASDAIDKLCYISLTDDKVGLERDDFQIRVTTDKESRKLIISDNGVGMTAAELETNLGVIAKSGSLKFKEEMDQPSEEIDIIGQFGVGFYSAFMIAERVTVISRAYGSDSANQWTSEGADGYTIKPAEKDSFGTDIIMELKSNTEDEDYSEFLEEYTLHSLVKKYSDYIRWPIIMDVTKSRQVESDELDSDGKKKMVWEDYTEAEVINSRVPIWQRPKNEAPDEEYAKFYKEKFFDFNDPAAIIRVSAEGTVSFKAMLFIPSEAPFDYFTREYKPGLQLYSSGILIMEHCADLLPEHFRFVRGVVDSQDLSLNISREMLQHDRQLKIIANNVEKKVRSELTKLMENSAEKYDGFYKSFGIQLKYGIVSGPQGEGLSDLLLFYSSKEAKLISLAEYVKHMPEEQKFIYYACGESAALLSKLPQSEELREKGYDILFLTDDIDEFVVRAVGKFEEKEFRSVIDGDLGLQSEDEEKEAAQQETDNKDILEFVKESLGDKITAARLSRKLKSYPVCLATQGDITLEMERYFKSIQARDGGMADQMKAQRVLEFNAGHKSFAALKKAYETDKEKASKYAQLLYGQALLMAGVPLEDPAEFAELVNEFAFS